MSTRQGAPHAADDLLRVGVVGCGRWGTNLVRTFAGLGVLGAVSDADPEVTRATASAYGVDGLSPSELFDSGAVDAVVIAAPAAQHHQLALQALAAGLHTFVEKPLALSPEDAEELCTAAASAGKVLMVGHLLRYHPVFRELLSLVRQGWLGRVRYVYSNRLNLGRFRQEENILWSFAPHDLSMILALADEEPVRVQAVAGSFLNRQVADVTTTHLHFPGGMQAHVFVSWLHPVKEQRLVVIGDDGMAVFNDGESWGRKLLHYPHRIEWHGSVPEAQAAEAVPVAVEQAEPLLLECEHFLSCIRTGASPLTDGAEALRVLRVLDQAQRSMTSDPGEEVARRG